MGLGNITDAKWYKTMMPKLYGWGAALVIIGALFKIEHLPGASIMLILGLGTEAIIFFFSAFEKQPEETDWSLVYPELAGMNDPNAAKRPAQQLDDALEKKLEADMVSEGWDFSQGKVVSTNTKVTAMSNTPQCIGKTKKGTQCKRKASQGGKYCYQHHN